jgi:hypothetical protein
MLQQNRALEKFAAVQSRPQHKVAIEQRTSGAEEIEDFVVRHPGKGAQI